jgi:3-hydroxyacyl-[acyl-carrier-protein] dehydratase
MRYFLIDHISEWKPGAFIKGVKNVAMSEDFLEFHFPKNPIMPGILLLEALSQLTGWLEAASSDFKNWFLISNVKKCSFYGFAIPSEHSGIRGYSGIATVKGKKKISAEFEGEIIPLTEIEYMNDKRNFFHLLTRDSKF